MPSMKSRMESLALRPEVRTLSNGITLITERIPYVHSCSVGVWAKAGSADETPAWSGIAHFLEHLFFKGTVTRSPRDLMHAIESRGGHMNAFTGREATCLYVKCLSEHVGTAIDVLGDVICNPVYADLEKERNVILEEITSALDTPDEYVFDLQSMQFWPDHSLGRPVAGFVETVSAMTLDDVRAFKEAWYRPDNMVVSVVGAFDEDAVAGQVEEHFGGLKGVATPKITGPPIWGSGTRFFEQDIGQDHVAMAFPAGPMADPGRFRYDLMSCILGGGSTSRLFERVREEAGLAYAVYAYHSAYHRAGMLGWYAAIGSENLDQTLSLVGEELRRMKRELVSDEELSSNREQMKGSLLFSMENTFHRMTRMARSWLFLERIVSMEEILSAIDAIDAESIRALAVETFNPERCALTVLGPDGSRTANLEF
jgi:predicted Zn-dependent peptidase